MIAVFKNAVPEIQSTPIRQPIDVFVLRQTEEPLATVYKAAIGEHLVDSIDLKVLAECGGKEAAEELIGRKFEGNVDVFVFKRFPIALGYEAACKYETIIGGNTDDTESMMVGDTGRLDLTKAAISQTSARCDDNCMFATVRVFGFDRPEDISIARDEIVNSLIVDIAFSDKRQLDFVKRGISISPVYIHAIEREEFKKIIYRRLKILLADPTESRAHECSLNIEKVQLLADIYYRGNLTTATRAYINCSLTRVMRAFFYL
jgi:hypothetical protein